MKTKLHLRFPVLVLLLGSFSLCAQDIHFTQFYNAPLTMNPALTGISKGDIRLSSLYRSQWNAANSPYKTFNVSAEKKFYNITHDSWWLSGGLDIFYDRAGDANQATTHIVLTGSYTKMLDRNNFISLGLSAGIGQRQFEFGNLTFDNQWNGDIFDPDRPVNENFNDPNLLYPDFGIGFNYRAQKARSRSKFDLGAGAFHFNRPNQSYQENDKSQLPVRLGMYAMPVFQISGTGDVVGAITTQMQDKYFEALASVGYRYHLSTKKSKEVAVQLGVGFRFNAIGDAVTPAAEFHYRDWMVGLSWDMNVSGFSTATNRNGGPEIAVRYIIHKVYPLKAYKACPLI
ncbi:MAG: PorP/SprF family type IX secretion system membrane protein [Bacteroidetes bacterium]|nr:PorP/SprF family type IX secretion system membrane protein [Bacteroidota bacterium]